MGTGNGLRVDLIFHGSLDFKASSALSGNSNFRDELRRQNASKE